MILPDHEIEALIHRGVVRVPEGKTPLDLDLQLGPSSLDVRMSDEILLFETHAIHLVDVWDKRFPEMRKIKLDPKEGFVLHPGEFILGATMEIVNVPNDLVIRLEGRSSLGRLGLIIHATAGFIDPGFEGQITLEMQNIGRQPILIRPNQRIGQLCFQRMTSPARKSYSQKKDSKYTGQMGPTGSRLAQEKRNGDVVPQKRLE